MIKRITVSLPEHLVEAANEAVRTGRAASVSAYVAQALSERADREVLSDFLDDWREQVGPATAEETRWAEAALGHGEQPAR